MVNELGMMFRDNASPLRSMVDSAQAFIEAARANESPTIDLLHNALPVLQTQADNSANIRSFADDLAALTGTRGVLGRQHPTHPRPSRSRGRRAVRLVRDLRRLLPPFLTHLVSVSEVLDARLPALEQILVTFPRLVSAGPSALLSEGDSRFGRVNLNLNQDPGPCMDGYLPPGSVAADLEEETRRHRRRSHRTRPSTRTSPPSATRGRR